MASDPVNACGLTVFHDGACPLCRREIRLYQGLMSAQPVDFVDVSQPEMMLPQGVSREQALARFHVRYADGRMESGARAFLALWALLPGWRWLAKLGALPGMPTVLEWMYVRFLRVRPSLQRLAARLERSPTR